MPWPTNEGRTFPAEPLTTDEVHRLIDAAPTRSTSGIRIRALIGVLYGSGLRLAEALALYPRDVDLEAGTIHVRNGKNRKARRVGIDTLSAALVARWLDHRTGLGFGGRQPAFVTYTGSHSGEPLSPIYVRQALARLADRAGIEKRVHPHGLRHSLAFDLAMSGTPTHVIQAQLGHASLAVTDRYVRHLAPSDVITIMNERDW